MVHRRFTGIANKLPVTKNQSSERSAVSSTFEAWESEEVVKFWPSKPKEVQKSQEDNMNGAKPIDQDEVSKFRQRVADEVSKRMGDLLLKGYTMLDQYCDSCQGILMQSRTDELICLQCTVVQEMSPVPVKPEPITELDSINDHEPSPKRVAVEVGVRSVKEEQQFSKMEISDDVGTQISLEDYAVKTVAQKLKWACDKLDASTDLPEITALLTVISTASNYSMLQRAVFSLVRQVRRKSDLLSLSKSLSLEEGHPFDSAHRRARIAGVSVELYKRRRRCKVPGIEEEVLFGNHPIFEALKAEKRRVHCVYAKDPSKLREEILESCSQRNIPLRTVTDKQLDILTEFQLHNGLCADVSPLHPEKFTPKELPVDDEKAAYVFLDGVLDPGNIGAIVRSAMFFGINGIVWAKGPKRLTASMSKASSGALERFPIFSVDSFASMHTILKPKGFSFYGTIDQESASRKGIQPEHLSKSKMPQKVVFVLGEEQRGISQQSLALCDSFITVSRSDHYSSTQVNSLNVGVCLGLLLHHWRSRMDYSSK